MNQMKRSKYMAYSFFIGFASAVLSYLIDLPVISPFFFIVSLLCGLIFAGNWFASIEEVFNLKKESKKNKKHG